MPRLVGARQWLDLQRDERDPEVLEAQEPHRVVWSSIWPSRPRDRVVFEITRAGEGSDLRWTLVTDDEEWPAEEVLAHLRHRINRLINADLRFSFGQ